MGVLPEPHGWVLGVVATPARVSETIDLGDRILARVERKGRGETSGLEIDYTFWVLMTFRDGRISRAEWFLKREDALEAARGSG